MISALAGMPTLPSPKGQMPAMARNSVDLPEPEGPISSVERAVPRSSAPSFTIGLPFGRRRVASRICRLSSREVSRPSASSLIEPCCASVIAASKEVRRLIEAR